MRLHEERLTKEIVESMGFMPTSMYAGQHNCYSLVIRENGIEGRMIISENDGRWEIQEVYEVLVPCGFSGSKEKRLETVYDLITNLNDYNFRLGRESSQREFRKAIGV